MKRIVLCIIGCLAIVLAGCSKKREGKPKVLVFSKTMGFKHASIPNGIAAIQKLGDENGFEVDTTTISDSFSEENLEKYASVIFLNTTGDVLDIKQEVAFERYIQAGGSYVGVHAAADTEYSWGWYGKLAGAWFQSHPAGTPEADFHIKDANFPATSFFTDSIWHRADEMYNYKKINPDVNVILTVDESTYEGGENGDFHPMSWYHEFDGGRAFYTALGHTEESYTEENYLKHLLGGIQYAIGDNLKLDYSKATSMVPPDANRFTKVELVVGDFYEPTEMAILPNRDVLVAQRRGEIMLYKHDTKEVKQVGYLDVYHKTLNTPGVNAEEGLMGLQKDPDFANNHWVYMYYAPTGDKWVNRLSRFKFENDTIDMGSEQIILEVESQREICCHTGGSIAFGGDGLLYLSAGDNSTPFNEQGEKYVNNGFAPLNDTPGHEQFDARRSSGNSNDLRGKIMRIKVNEDGSYDIPEGNLFPVGTPKSRPEIYTMGHRNPYRISVDQKNGNLYWGDVGPDARADSLETRGPRGYDEVGQAREAGNYGWPYFIGDNYAYREYNYETGESGMAFDPEKPLNNSRNNTGLTELPSAKSAFIWYPYTASSDFPGVGTGGRNAMAGPVYYTDMYPEGESRLPDYYDGKVIIYEWIRGWMKAVTLDPNGDFNKMEPFAPDIKLNNLIDMEVGPEGRIYLLEYGSGWFANNDDSGLSYIDFNGGNRPPVIEGVEVDVTSGKSPMAINAKIMAEDLEGNDITYVWDFGNGETKETNVPEVAYTYADNGEYKISVEAKDDEGASASSEVTNIFVGNTRPEVKIDIVGGNQSFFIPGQAVEYKVSVTDDGSSDTIDDSNVYVSVNYMEGMDEASLSNVGHQQASASIAGKVLTQTMDCKSCHKENEKSIGPSYLEVSKKYQTGRRSSNFRYIQEKIVQGGSGVWGEVNMPAHPDITVEEKAQIANWILSLADTRPKKASLPLSGKIVPEASNSGSTMVLSASYTDGGENGVKPLTGVKTVALTSNTVSFDPGADSEGFMSMNYNGMDLLIVNSATGWFVMEDIDLSGVKAVTLMSMWQAPPVVGFDFEVRLNNAEGELIGSGSLNTPLGPQGAPIVIPLTTALSGKQTLYISYNRQKETEEAVMVALANATFN
ncbi:glucose/arabinose dehydrogenase/cytochrome c551/c552/type 1 glutamine amidotransferase [Saonia flava]|uniref:Glucose/arabinose dehydrogenase/cytochrome c551/c552/type 1 glutamine amidotransferase n=1 Tax=Saonia flava TaxID=523696 RepID=A0A846R402_9FLAO|nr:ThuA domain-containing protein [Saonia flava]NJB72084.1 glucose/arabinose dehydrogenase/cytochrome c551/c552/type 1 glutamine amidotransferase [Saonia flava]